MEKEAKKMEKPLEHSYIRNKLYVEDLEKYCNQLEKDLDELKLKEKIAHDAKEIAQDAHQKSQKELKAIEKERDGLKKELKKVKIWLHKQQDLKESIVSWVEGQKYAFPEEDPEYPIFNKGIESAISVIQDSMYKKSTLAQELQALKGVGKEILNEWDKKMANQKYGNDLWKSLDKLEDLITSTS